MKRPSDPSRPIRAAVRTLLAVAVGAGLILSIADAARSTSAGAASTGGQVNYSATTNIAAPPPVTFAGFAGGDGWAVALSSTQVFNVFHHQATLQVACHLQSDASSCWSAPETVIDASSHNFATSNAPGLYLDQSTGHMFVYAVRTSDSTAGVVCINTTLPASATGAQRFCGFTALSAVGEAPIATYAGVSAPAQVGTKWYSFNEVAGVGAGAGAGHTENSLLCFDLATDAACTSQPFALSMGAEVLSSFSHAYPIGAAGSKVFVQVVGTISSVATNELACFDSVTHSGCTGAWPITVVGTPGGAPFPLLNSGGTAVGTCLPIGGNPCFGMNGASTGTPSGMAGAIGGTNLDNGSALILGARVYVPNATKTAVDCYDFSTTAPCANFPKTFGGTLALLYTVIPDPQRPNCIWVNSDTGSGQIQNFDAISGGACEPQTVKVSTKQIVARSAKCVPSSYTSLQVTVPTRGSYASGLVQFEDSSGTPIPGIPLQSLDTSGSIDLTPFGLPSISSYPQFVITLNGETVTPGLVQVNLNWVGAYSTTCTSGGQTVSAGVNGYWLVATDGGIFSYGAHAFYGSTGAITLNKPIVGMASTPDRGGYWLVASDGGIFSFGDASFYGSTGGISLNKPIVGMASTPDGGGYWLVATDGGIFSFGDAAFYGSTGAIALNKPIAGMASTPDGGGYWLVATDGGIFSFGDANFHGSTGAITLNKPIVGMASTPAGGGYWLVATDGGIFSFGDANFHGSTGAITLNKPIVGMASTSDGGGYWLVASDGGIFSFGDASFYGSAGAITLNKPIVGMAA